MLIISKNYVKYVSHKLESAIFWMNNMRNGPKNGSKNDPKNGPTKCSKMGVAILDLRASIVQQVGNQIKNGILLPKLF